MFKRHKYKAKPTNGFPSKLESAVYDYLVRRESLGEIAEIKRQCAVVLKNCDVCGTRVSWKVDFSFIETASGEIVYAEAKGVETADYKRKLKLWKKNPPARLEIYKGSGTRIRLVEKVEVAA